MEVQVIHGSFYGSCSKRLFSEYYCNEWEPDTIVTNALPNSGGFDSAGRKWSVIPIGYPANIAIAPGSAINLEQLAKETQQLPEGARVYIHENTVVVQPRHCENEKGFVSIGSTMTGGAEAVIEKMRRNPNGPPLIARDVLGKDKVLNNKQWLDMLHGSQRVLGLCAQGHSLSINYGFYPYCTSRNTSPAQLIADAGLPVQSVTRVIGCMRTFPIRVSNRFNEEGEMIGYSGPGYSDQVEMTWEEVGVPPEMTSISKKVRRVFSFSFDQLLESVAVCGTTDLFLGFINYIPADQQKEFIQKISAALHGTPCKVSWIGYDKTIKDIVPIEDYKFNKSWV
jgi:adenylosuccinate synthase